MQSLANSRYVPVSNLNSLGDFRPLVITQSDTSTGPLRVGLYFAAFRRRFVRSCYRLSNINCHDYFCRNSLLQRKRYFYGVSIHNHNFQRQTWTPISSKAAVSLIVIYFIIFENLLVEERGFNRLEVTLYSSRRRLRIWGFTFLWSSGFQHLIWMDAWYIRLELWFSGKSTRFKAIWF